MKDDILHGDSKRMPYQRSSANPTVDFFEMKKATQPFVRLFMDDPLIQQLLLTEEQAAERDSSGHAGVYCTFD